MTVTERPGWEKGEGPTVYISAGKRLYSFAQPLYVPRGEATS